MAGRLTAIKAWARRLKQDVVAIWIAARDRRTPARARVAAYAVAAYALSPVDLIPDFIPVLGYLDDLLIVPLGIALVVALVPAPLMRDYRREAEARAQRPGSLAGLLAIILIWAALAGWLAIRLLRQP